MNPIGNFLNLPPELTDPAAARYAILPVPYEGTVCYMPGTAAGPAAIIDASAQVERFDEELLADLTAAGIATYPPVAAAASPAQQMDRVYEAAGKVLGEGKFLLTLGGEHSISAPLVRAARERFGELSVLQLDAHADLRDSYGGTGLSHACVMRRVMEVAPRLCQVGIRNVSLEEFQSCPRQVKNFITPRIIEDDPNWIDRALALLGEKVYLTIDIDVFDPSYVPGTGTPEPGGLNWRQVTSLLRRLCTQRQLVSADIVEVAPVPGSHVSEFLAARLAYKIIAYTQIR